MTMNIAIIITTRVLLTSVFKILFKNSKLKNYFFKKFNDIVSNALKNKFL